MQMDLGLQSPIREPLIYFPAAGSILACIRGVSAGAIIGVWSPGRAGTSSLIKSALQKGQISSVIYTSCIAEDSLGESLLSLGIQIGCFKANQRPGNLTKKSMMLAITDAIISKHTGVMVFEHLEFEEQEFHRAIFAIAKDVWSGGGVARFIIHFSGRKKRGNVLDLDLKAEVTMSINIEEPDKNHILSVFYAHMGDQGSEIASAFALSPRPEVVNEFMNRILSEANGDMVATVNLARRLKFFFGSLAVDNSYFRKVTEYMAENAPEPRHLRLPTI